MRCTGMFSIKEDLNLHWSDAMTFFPTCSNATGEWILHCQGSSQCVSIRAWDWTDNLYYPSKKHVFLARDGKEIFLIPDTSQTLCFVGETVAIASFKCEHTLMMKCQNLKKKKKSILVKLHSQLAGKCLKAFCSSSDTRLKPGQATDNRWCYMLEKLKNSEQKLSIQMLMHWRHH